ncbi:PREDICTED: uncharacterized protein LOC109205259 [Nicotiana attenuata]|uniref:uncharacterized protein LOC109205259 n=1 Tax=Nicotiana attenuata TaxID=49451 RepID=UPI000904F4F3|nr:PREDICTED: uncharacterized protein LOC109205259 [Nicotiana attenuata]
MVADALSRRSMGSLTRLPVAERRIVKEAQQIASQGVRLDEKYDGRGAQFTAQFWQSFQEGLGTRVNLSTAFHPQKYGYQASIQMAPEALCGRRCRSPMRWFEIGETKLIGPTIVQDALKKVKLIQERVKIAQSRQKSYTDIRHCDLEFREALPPKLSAVHPVFHVSMQKLYFNDRSYVIDRREIEFGDTMSYEEVSVAIIDRQVRRLQTKNVASVKVMWSNHSAQEATWEPEEAIREKYPYLFEISGT